MWIDPGAALTSLPGSADWDQASRRPPAPRGTPPPSPTGTHPPLTQGEALARSSHALRMERRHDTGITVLFQGLIM